MSKVVVTYVFPLNGAGQFFDLAVNFVSSYEMFPPGIEHDTIIICNGAKPTDEAQCLFGSMQNVSLFEHDNSGLDLGGYQHVAREVPADLMVFFGASSYVRGPGWLARMVEAWKLRGDTLLGTMGNRGNDHYAVQPHIRTSSFWLSPSLFNRYPHLVTTPGGRFPMEHGPECLTTWVRSQRLTPYVVGWKGEFTMEQWDHMGGFQQQNQYNLIAGDRHSRIPYGSDP